MALDGVFLRLVKEELEEKLIGGRVDKIHQPSREEVVISIRNNGKMHKLLICTGAGSARIHITNSEIENPKTPPMFCMLLRKYLTSGKLLSIRQDGLERILYLDFVASNEMGDMIKICVACEIMGRRSNLILINEDGKIIDSIKRVAEDVSSVRQVLPGMSYTLPPREEKISLFDFNEDEFYEKISAFPSFELSKGIMKTLEGISPVFAREIAFFVTRGDDLNVEEILSTDKKDRLTFYLKEVHNSLVNKTNKFIILKDKHGIYKDFCFTNINQYKALYFTSEVENGCTLLDKYFSERDLKARMKQKASDLFKFLVNTSDRITRRIAIQKSELNDCKERDFLRTCGELISANIYRINKGDEKVSLENFYDEKCPMVTIELDKKLTPSQNAQKYFTEYKKLDVAEKKLTTLIKSGEEELVYIDSVFDVLTRATTEIEIAELRIELAEQGYLKAGRFKGKLPKSLPPKKFTSADGFTILVGRNNKQNDKLTLKDAAKTDIWLHTHNIPGSHVIILAEGQEVPDSTIEEACKLAVLHSKAKNSAQVPVDYTQVRYVKKPSGAKPGMVIFTNNKTAYISGQLEVASMPAPDKV